MNGKKAFGITSALWSYLLGVCLPYVPIFGKHYVNVFWSFLDGLGLYVTDLLLNYGRSPLYLIGFFIWPVFIAYLVHRLTVGVWDRTGRGGRTAGACLMFASSFAVIGAFDNPTIFGVVLPTFWNITSYP